MKRFICLFLVLVMSSLALSSCAKTGKDDKTDTSSAAVSMDEIDFSAVDDMSKVEVVDEVTDYVLIDVADHGKILVRLYPDVAPGTVENFKKLVSEKFYDGLTFHRVSSMVVQGGDPQGNGYGGSSQKIKGEFAANGFVNNLKHVRGVLSMARSNDYNSASSQFFICPVDYPDWNGQYAAFGFVVNGLDVVDAITKVPTNSHDRPRTNVVISSMRFATVK